MWSPKSEQRKKYFGFGELLSAERNRDDSQSLCPWRLLPGAWLISSRARPREPSFFWGQVFPGLCLLLVIDQTKQKSDHLKRGLEWRNWKLVVPWAGRKRFVQMVFWTKKKKRKRMLEEKEKKFHSVSGLGAFLTRWLTGCERMKRSVGKRNACVLLKVNIVLLISLDFSMKLIWVLMPGHFWDCLQGHRMAHWLTARALEQSCSHSHLWSAPPNWVTPGWEVPGRPVTFWICLYTGQVGVIASKASYQLCHPYFFVPCYNSVCQSRCPLHPSLI